MKAKNLIILGVFAACISSCGKDMPSIGGGDPQNEFEQCMRISSKGHFEDAIQCLEMFKARYPQTRLGQEAELKIGDSYFAKKDYLLAAESYLAFLRLHPRSNRADYAHYMTGEAYFKESPKAIDRDQEYLESAIDHLRIAIRSYPDGPYSGLAKATLEKAVTRVARRSFYIGRFYYRTGEYIAAIPRLWEVAEKYPEAGLGDKALYMAVEANLRLKRLEGAKEAYGALATNFSNSKYTKRAEHKLLRRVKN